MDKFIFNIETNNYICPRCHSDIDPYLLERSRAFNPSELHPTDMFYNEASAVCPNCQTRAKL